MVKFEENQFFEISRAKISKMEEKNNILAAASFFYFWNL